MAIKTVLFKCVGTPDTAFMKNKLSSMSGIVEMNIDAKSHSINVRYDESITSDSCIAAGLDNPNYQMQN